MNLKSFKEIVEDTTAASAGVGTVGTGYDPKLGPKKKGKDFNVPTEIFRRFQTGRNKFERWSKFLNLEDDNQKAIYDYALRNRDATIVLRDETTGAMRAIRQRASNGI